MQKLVKIIAEAISLVFSPLAWVFYLVYSVIVTGVFHVDQFRSIIIIAGLILTPIFYLFYELKNKKISDFDISIRTQRYSMLIVANTCMLALTIYLKLINLPVLFHLFLIIFVILFLISFITLKYKISFHMANTVTSAVIINYLFGFTIPWLYITIPLIFWSRLYLKQHTFDQLVSAILLSSLVLYLFLK